MRPRGQTPWMPPGEVELEDVRRASMRPRGQTPWMLVDRYPWDNQSKWLQ